MILGIYGLQDSGKTTIVEKLIRGLAEKGYKVSSVKHTRKRLSVDTVGKDTWRHARAGSDPVVFSSEIETAFIKHSMMGVEDIVRLLEADYRPDIIILEGFKKGPYPKVAMGSVKPRLETVLANPSLKELMTYAVTGIELERTMADLPGLDCGKCGTSCEGLARRILEGEAKPNECVELPRTDVEVSVGGKSLPLGMYAAKAVEGAVRGIVGTLKGYEPGEEVEVRLGAAGERAGKAVQKRRAGRRTH